MDTYLVAGSTGLAGSAIVRYLKNLSLPVIEVSSQKIDLTNFDVTREFIASAKPDVVINAAGKVGGIQANYNKPVDFFVINSMIQLNIFRACALNSINKVVFLSSSCVYPKFSPQPIKEEYLLTGKFEETNSAYAIAKISGMRLVQAYRQQFGFNWTSIMPTNLFGFNDNFSLTNGHFMPSLIRKFNEALLNKNHEVTLWGTGKPRRELMFSDDFAEALLHVTQNYDSDEPINIGTGVDHSIKEISEMVKSVTNFKGDIVWDHTKPDGTPRKLLDITKLHELGFKKTYDLSQRIKDTSEWFLNRFRTNRESLRL